MSKASSKSTAFGRLLSNRQRTMIMGIVNATPDSFSDGEDGERPLDKALRLLDEGADLLDLGGESTRPGAPEVASGVEKERILPVLTELLRLRPNVIVSVDTSKIDVAHAALDFGAAAINDVWGLRTQEGLPELVKRYDAGVIVMHSRANSALMRNLCDYKDVVSSVEFELKRLYRICVEAGVQSDSIVIDPGLGFAKTPEQDLSLLRATERLGLIGPILIGHSRKSFIGKLLGIDEPQERDVASLAISLFAAEQGAAIVRVHEIKSTVEAFRMLDLLGHGSKKL